MTEGNPEPGDQPVLSSPPRLDRLDSWKEIAAYLGRDVRTVRRWEKGQALPVHRHHHQKAASIYAYKTELEAWWKNGHEGLSDEENDNNEKIKSAEDVWEGQSAVEAGPVVEQPATRRRFRTALMALLAVLLAGAAGSLTWLHFKPPVPARAIVLAVLPFEDMDESPQEYLVDGLTEEMIAKLTRISPQYLRVIARTSAMQYRHTSKGARQIGQELGADYILENSLRREGGKFRITTQLVRTADQTHLWAENYDREAGELLPMESELTTSIAEQVSHQLLPPALVHPPASSPQMIDTDAYQLYLQGRYYSNQRSREGLQKSVEFFEQAVSKEPGYAAAYAGLADAYNLTAFYGFDPTLNVVGRAKVAADQALQLDESLAAAHAALGYTDFMWREDWPEAERQFQRALELDDNYVPARQWYALYLAAAGRMDESVSQMEYAKRLDPLSPAVHAGLAYVYYFARDYRQSVEHAHMALQLNPNSLATHATLGWDYTEQRNYAGAIEELQTVTKLSGGASVYLCSLARAYALSGNRREAGRIVAEVQAMPDQPRGFGSALAGAYLALGNSELALYWLERTAPGDVPANWLRVDPVFDPLRQNPRFLAVLARIATKAE